ncbi:rhodanese-like domain-containing protein [Nocardioides humilatus]|uniref:Rhodanese-like domain-containing protein n=1 Tax=Nocardioides humilatus TaxID=2607660 RepID=A0A5B1LMU1_9ACTN|nr:rhodanese-like domain-containing protein [Nocardioides humilatus]KAA1421961.1 rhodanese-like domain-containing protein [Nocardioides humilatus]
MQIPTVSIHGVPDPLPAGVTVVDVRQDDEWQAGHVDGSLHIPLHDLPARIDEIPEGQILVVCRVGARSAQAVAYLAQRGHDAINLDGGLYEWEAAARPLVSDTGGPAYVA